MPWVPQNTKGKQVCDGLESHTGGVGWSVKGRPLKSHDFAVRLMVYRTVSQAVRKISW